MKIAHAAGGRTKATSAARPYATGPISPRAVERLTVAGATPVWYSCRDRACRHIRLNSIPASISTTAKSARLTGLPGYSPIIAVGNGMKERASSSRTFSQSSPLSTRSIRRKKRWWLTQNTATKKKLRR